MSNEFMGPPKKLARFAAKRLNKCCVEKFIRFYGGEKKRERKLILQKVIKVGMVSSVFVETTREMYEFKMSEINVRRRTITIMIHSRPMVGNYGYTLPSPSLLKPIIVISFRNCLKTFKIEFMEDFQGYNSTLLSTLNDLARFLRDKLPETKFDVILLQRNRSPQLIPFLDYLSNYERIMCNYREFAHMSPRNVQYAMVAADRARGNQGKYISPLCAIPTESLRIVGFKLHQFFMNPQPVQPKLESLSIDVDFTLHPFEQLYQNVFENIHQAFPNLRRICLEEPEFADTIMTGAEAAALFRNINEIAKYSTVKIEIPITISAKRVKATRKAIIARLPHFAVAKSDSALRFDLSLLRNLATVEFTLSNR